MDRRSFFSLAGTAFAAAALAGCGAQPTASPSAGGSATSAAKATTIGLTYIPNIQFAPFYVAAGSGLFGGVGAQVVLRHHGANEGLFTALAAGQEDFVIAGGDEILQARSQGVDLVAVAAYYHAYPVVVLVRDSAPIRTLADLKGKRLGVPGKYGESWFGALLALESAGLTQREVTVVEIGYTQQAALSTGKVDAVMGFSNNDQVQFGLAGLKVRALPVASGTPRLVGACLAASGSMIASRPDVVKKVSDALVQATQRVVDDPAGAIRAATAYVPGLGDQAAQSAALATLEATRPLWVGPKGTASGRFDPAQWSAMADFMASSGLTAARIDPAAAFSNDFVTG